jgi:hypothetical protein
MRILTPSTLAPDEIAWEGELALPDPTIIYKSATPVKARVAIGKPVWWPAGTAVEGETGKKWTPPAGDRAYTLLRLACTLYPPAERYTHYRTATLSLFLRPRSGPGAVVAHDLYPRRLTQSRTGKFSISLTPELTFAEGVSVKPGELGAEIEFEQALPVVQSYGLGQANPAWEFQRQTAHPLLGDLAVYAVTDTPADATGLRLTIELMATLETRYGPVRLALPDAARAHVSQVIAM